MLRSIVCNVDHELDEPRIIRNPNREKLEDLLQKGAKVWIDITDSTDDEVEWIREHFHLHPLIISDIMRVDTRPSLITYPDYLFISLFQCSLEQAGVQSHEIHCLLGEDFFITVRSAAAVSINAAYEHIAQNEDSWDRPLAYFLYLSMQHVVDSYYPLLDRISNRLSNLEKDILLSDQPDPSQMQVYLIKQQLIKLRQVIAPQREVLSNVLADKRLSNNDEIRDLFRHLYERFMRVYDVINSQRDLSANVMDLLRDQEAKLLAKTVSRLTIISMIFLPLTFLIGLFELNFITTDPELTIPISGASMLVFIIGLMSVSTLAMSVIFRRRGWI